MGAFGTDPTPLLPSHVRIVERLTIARKMQPFSLHFFHGGGDVIGAEAQVMDMLTNFVEPLAERRSGGGLDELNLG